MLIARKGLVFILFFLALAQGRVSQFKIVIKPRGFLGFFVKRDQAWTLITRSRFTRWQSFNDGFALLAGLSQGLTPQRDLRSAS